MMKTFFLLILILCYSNLVFSQTEALNLITREGLKKHLDFIASDSLQGRSFGTSVPGLNIAANYLAENARLIGLRPGFQNFFQPVAVFSSQPDGENTFLEITNRTGNVVFRTDSIVSFSGKKEISINKGILVFAGFGWVDEKLGWDDFAGLDLTGKVVLICAGTPTSFEKKEKFSWNNRVENAKIERAKNKGARAVILINSLFDEKNDMYSRVNRWMDHGGYSLETKDKTEPFPFILTTKSIADVIFGKGELEKILHQISRKRKSHTPAISDFTVNATVKRKTETIESKNVIGIIDGSDPVLKNECVVVMAHYDHLGIDENGDVYNGADDNGSGTVTLLEVAKALMNLDNKPKRSIVFLWVTAEEVGMLGSQYYSENPIFPMQKTKTCINIDMDGRVFELRDTVWNNSPKKVKDFNGLFTLTNDVWPQLKTINTQACEKLGLIPDYSLPPNFLRSSDHYSFHKNGVPILNLATGYHADYHKPTDEVSKINFDKMKRVAELCFLVTLDVANVEE